MSKADPDINEINAVPTYLAVDLNISSDRIYEWQQQDLF